MSDSFSLYRSTLDSNSSIAISEEEFLKLKFAHDALLEFTYIEEKFDLFIENYFDLEAKIIAMGLRFMIFVTIDDFQFDRINFNRTVVNFLTSCRMYVDQSDRHLKRIYGEESSVYRSAKEGFSREYDHNFEYRVMEALRNYAQHRGHPVYGSIYSQSNEMLGEEFYIKYVVAPTLKPSVFKDDAKVKRSVYEELAQLGDKQLDLRPFIRSYTSSICKVHGEIGELMAADVTEWKSTINSAIETFRVQYEEKGFIGLRAGKFDKDKLIDYVPLVSDFLSWLEKLQTKHAGVGRLPIDKMFLSGEPMLKNENVEQVRMP